MKPLLTLAFLLTASVAPALAQTERPTGPDAATQAKTANRVRSLRVLVLSTMLADAGIGEWGFSALVEVDGHRILFDTGAHPDTVLKNARELGVFQPEFSGLL